MEDLRGIRAGRYKRRETWKQEDQTGKILYEAGMAVGNAMEGLEDVLRELAEEGDYGAAARARRVTELRKQVKEAQAVYKKIECGAKHGWSMAVAVYETHLETADMTEEEAKRLQAELKSRKKEEGENQKGGKYKIPKLKHEEPETVTQQVAAAPTWNWQNMMPPAMLQAMMTGRMPMMGMGIMPQWNNAGGSGTAVQQEYTDEKEKKHCTEQNNSVKEERVTIYVQLLKCNICQKTVRFQKPRFHFYMSISENSPNINE